MGWGAAAEGRGPALADEASVPACLACHLCGTWTSSIQSLADELAEICLVGFTSV